MISVRVGAHAWSGLSIPVSFSSAVDMSEKITYPGSCASAEEVVYLATEYHQAAHTLLQNARKGKPFSRAPARLCAIHAIELYLNAFLLYLGETPGQIRSRQHNLAEKTRLAVDGGLTLRKKTAGHLIKMSQDREYLISRYGPETATTLSEVNRLMATLEEVGKKVRSVVLGRSAAADLAGTPAPQR